MYTILAIAAVMITLLVAGLGIIVMYMLLTGKGREMLERTLTRWTWFDVVILSVFIIGALFLLTDVIGVLRDRDAYPYYHYGYLLSGFTYYLLAGICMFIRLGLTLRYARGLKPKSGSAAPANYHHDKPDQAQSAE